MRRIVQYLSLCLFVMPLLVACGGDDDEPATPSIKVDVASVSLSQTNLTLAIGSTATLTATVSPDNATDKTVTWKSSNSSVASVSSNGEVKAVGAGTTTITASAGGKSAICQVTVKQESGGIGAGIDSWDNSGGEYDGTVN